MIKTDPDGTEMAESRLVLIRKSTGVDNNDITGEFQIASILAEVKDGTAASETGRMRAYERFLCENNAFDLVNRDRIQC